MAVSPTNNTPSLEVWSAPVKSSGLGSVVVPSSNDTKFPAPSLKVSSSVMPVTSTFPVFFTRTTKRMVSPSSTIPSLSRSEDNSQVFTTFIDASAPVMTSTASESVIDVDDGSEAVTLTVLRISLVSAAATVMR